MSKFIGFDRSSGFHILNLGSSWTALAPQKVDQQTRPTVISMACKPGLRTITLHLFQMDEERMTVLLIDNDMRSHVMGITQMSRTARRDPERDSLSGPFSGDIADFVNTYLTFRL